MLLALAGVESIWACPWRNAISRFYTRDSESGKGQMVLDRLKAAMDLCYRRVLEVVWRRTFARNLPSNGGCENPTLVPPNYLRRYYTV